jgi:hypothetical protein
LGVWHKHSVALATLIFVASGVLAKGQVLSGGEIHQRFEGRTVTDGTHWSYTLKSNSSVSAIDMGKARAGQWRISAGELCIRVPAKAAEDCWTVRQTKEQLFLVREGGDPIEITIQSPANE